MGRIIEFWNWLQSIDATFAFLLALPFLVALAGFAALPFQRNGPP